MCVCVCVCVCAVCVCVCVCVCVPQKFQNYTVSISFLRFLSPGDGTTYNIQSGDNLCDAVNGTGCTYNYYVLSNGTNIVVGVVDIPGMKVLFPCYLNLQSARVGT